MMCRIAKLLLFRLFFRLNKENFIIKNISEFKEAFFINVLKLYIYRIKLHIKTQNENKAELFLKLFFFPY